MSNEKLPDQVFDLMQERLGYNDDEAKLFKDNPRNTKVMQTATDMRNKTIVFEVVQSKGCNSQHKVGAKFYFSGDGNLLTKMAPSRVCAYLLPIMGQAIYGIQELWYAGVDPNNLCFKRAGCFDVGVQCGGWGNVVIESKVMPRDEAQKLFETGLSGRL
jgi:hypothetical protein